MKVTNYQKFLKVMKNPPRKLNIELDDLLLNIYNNNPYTLYRRNEIIRLKQTDPDVNNFNVLLTKMWNNESDEVKGFYKILAIEGNRRFKLRYQQLLNSQMQQLYEYYQQQLSSSLSYGHHQTQPQLPPSQLQYYWQLYQMPNEFYSYPLSYEYSQPQPQPLSQPLSQPHQQQQQPQQPQQQSQPHLISHPLPTYQLQPQPQQEEFLQPYKLCRSQQDEPLQLQSNEPSEQHGQSQLPIPYDFYFY